VRLLVEPALIAAMVPDMSKSDIDTMSRALDEMERATHATKAYQAAHLRFHDVALSRYPPVIKEMIQSIYEKIHRHQRLHFSRPQIPEDFTNVDRCFLEAIKSRDAQLARYWLEFHLIDAGLGLALDIDETHVPSALLLAAKGAGIDIDCSAEHIARPVRIQWRDDYDGLRPAMNTVNLKYTPRTRPKRKVSGS
jgi:hypothetical protein